MAPRPDDPDDDATPAAAAGPADAPLTGTDEGPTTGVPGGDEPVGTADGGRTGGHEVSAGAAHPAPTSGDGSGKDRDDDRGDDTAHEDRGGDQDGADRDGEGRDRPGGDGGDRPDDSGDRRDGGADDGSSGHGGDTPGSSASAAGPARRRTGREDADAPAEPELTDDERWAAIVAELGDIDGYDGALPPSQDDEPSEPRDLPATGWTGSRVVRPAQDAADEPTHAARPRHEDLAGARDWDGTSQYEAAEEAVDELEHFVPPEPGPVLGGDPLLTMAWFAVVGMPLFLLVVLIGWHDAPVVLVQAAAAVFVLGIAVLVWRMPHRRDPGDDDTGAVV